MPLKPYLIFARHSPWDAWEIAADAECLSDARRYEVEQRDAYYGAPDSEVILVRVVDVETQEYQRFPFPDVPESDRILSDV